MTNLPRHLDSRTLESMVIPAMLLAMKSPEQGAATTVWAAVGKRCISCALKAEKRTVRVGDHGASCRDTNPRPAAIQQMPQDTRERPQLLMQLLAFSLLCQ
jgi:hypothetical protein